MHLVRDRAHQFGVRGIDPQALSFDLRAAVGRKDEIVGGIISGIKSGLAKTAAITYINGRAAFLSPREIRVGKQTITADKTIMAVGSRVAKAQIPGLEDAGYLTNNEALKLHQVPASMVIIGAGYVGVEFAQMYARFGTRVTLVSRSARVMRNEEPELSEALGHLLVQEGINLLTDTAVTAAGQADGQRYVEVKPATGKVQRLEAEQILLAAGRTARIEDLGLEQAGVALQNGFIQANGQLQTTAPNIWSLGDANGGQMFTHRAIYDGVTSALNAVLDKGRTVDYRVVPRAVFTEPALASVGLTQAEAEARGASVSIGTYAFSGSGRGKAMGATEGLVKIVADDKTGEILGGHILGAHADMLIHELVVAMQQRATARDLGKTIHIHPTLNEIVQSAAKAVK